MISRPIDAINYNDIRDLVVEGRSEGRNLEYKLVLPGQTDGDKTEFLADVSSLANSNGGDIIFGVQDQSGIAVGLQALHVVNPDAEIVRLESIIKDGLDPRLAVRSHWIDEPNANGFGLLVIRVPASLSAPHRVKFKNNGRFWARLSRAKQEMDVNQLRDAFTAAAGLPSRLRSLHDIWTADAKLSHPMMLVGGADAHFSIIPITILREQLDLSFNLNNSVHPPFIGGGFDCRHTLDGWLNSNVPVDDGGVYSYALTHRTGYMDASFHIGAIHNGVGKIYINDFEATLQSLVKEATEKLTSFGVEGPWAIFLTISRANGYSLELGLLSYSSRPLSYPRDLTFPDLLIDAYDDNCLMPLLRLIWFAFGQERPIGRLVGDGRGRR